MLDLVKSFLALSRFSSDSLCDSVLRAIRKSRFCTESLI